MTPHVFGGHDFFLKGADPRILLVSGTHGNEAGVIDCLKAAVDRYKNLLPSFLFIPEFSPSAVALGTRQNLFGTDLNRDFSSHSADPEVRRLIEILSRFSFDFCFSFHEDPEFKQFYLYDSHCLSPDHLAQFRQRILASGTKLYSGIDDPADPHLNTYVDRGYVCFDRTPTSFDHWALKEGIIKRSFIPEIPGAMAQKQKDKLVKIVFEELILKLTRQSFLRGYKLPDINSTLQSA